MSRPRLLFAGTPAFALASLEALCSAGHRPVAVLTQPDRAAGRGRKLAPSPVATYALGAGLTVMKPGTLRDEAVCRALAQLAPDLMIVAAYGLILPAGVLGIPARGCLNVHASLLPRWRGAAPVQAAILAGDSHTGVCLMQMETGLDTGPVYACEQTAIGEGETAGELGERLAAAGGRLLVDRLGDILEGRLAATPQDAGQASWAPKITSGDARLDWQRPAAELERRVRAMNPVPGAWFLAGGERVKCWSASLADGVRAEPGSVVSAGADGIVVACGRQGLVLRTLQRPGRKRVTAGEFAAAADPAGTRFG